MSKNGIGHILLQTKKGVISVGTWLQYFLTTTMHISSMIDASNVSNLTYQSLTYRQNFSINQILTANIVSTGITLIITDITTSITTTSTITIYSSSIVHSRCPEAWPPPRSIDR